MSVEFADVIEGNLVVGEEAAVKNQVLAADKGGQGQSREAFGEDLENSTMILAQTI